MEHLAHLTSHACSHAHAHHHSCWVHAAVAHIHGGHIADVLHAGTHNFSLYVDCVSSQIGLLCSEVGTMHRRIGLRVLSVLCFFAHTSQHILLVIHLDLRLTSHRSVAHSGIGSQLAEHIGLVLHRDIVCLTRSQILELLVVLAALVETDIGDIQACRPDTQAVAQVSVYLLVDKARPSFISLA